MSKPVECDITMSCLLCDWSIEAKNAAVGLSAVFLKEAHAHADEHEQHAVEIIQRVRVYSANYVEPTPHEPGDGAGVGISNAPETEPAAQLQDLSMAEVPEETQTAVAKLDSGTQTGFEDMPRRTNQ